VSEVVLRMEHIVKEFPGVRALDNVNFEARSGELLALMGENGAGKSTLMKVLGGVWPYPTYQGDIFIKGEKKRFYSPRDAEQSGVAIIFQELNLIPELSVAENIFLDRQPTNRFGVIDWRQLNSGTQALLDELGIRDVKPGDQVRSLTVGKQQMVEIAKALSKRARILVLDEPTSALTDKEVADLFRIIRKLKQDGVCMCYISHKMEEIKQIADRVVVLRDGRSEMSRRSPTSPSTRSSPEWSAATSRTCFHEVSAGVAKKSSRSGISKSTILICRAKKASSKHRSRPIAAKSLAFPD
jgi:D-xylose transport system ATP-binding protein